MLKLIQDDYSKLFIFSQSIMNDDTIGPFIKYLNDKDIYYEGYQ